jgi:SPP1 gp7 family putative phage head morphogenesis protein
MEELAAEGHTIVDTARQDAFENLLDYANRVTALVNRVGVRVRQLTATTTQALGRVADEIVATGRREWQRILQAGYGQNFIKPETWLPSALSAWRTRNADLTRDIEEETTRKIKDAMMESLRSNPTLTSLRQDVSREARKAYDRADLIARDQTAKLNSTLNQQRQRDFGVKSYRWRTMADEKVRATHARNAGLVCDWAKPPPVTGHPGHDPNCRCWGEPVLPPMEVLV